MARKKPPSKEAKPTPETKDSVTSESEGDKAVQAVRKQSLKKQRGLLFFIGTMGLLTLLAGIAFVSWNFVQYKFTATGPLAEDTTVTVPKGAGASSIATLLEKNGVIDDSWYFKLLVRMDDVGSSLKAGEFNIPAGANMRDVVEILQKGEAILYPFTAPEGLTSAQIVRAMAKIDTLIDDNPATPAEGSLLPETYMTPRGMSRSALVADMKKAQTDLLDELWDKRQADLPISTREEAIILASVVEKETGVTSERDVVAGVFINRLRRGMRLQSDPTIIYGVSQGEPLGRGIRQSEIDRVTDWNTYQIDGLPKTPICNPGREAIAAVLNPADTQYLYFVADGTGGHVFGKTLAEHNENVKNWRKVERERRRKAAAAKQNE